METILLVMGGIGLILLGITTLSQLASFYITYKSYKIGSLETNDLDELTQYAKEIMANNRETMARSKGVAVRPREEKKVR